jgi:hypothetical protein
MKLLISAYACAPNRGSERASEFILPNRVASFYQEALRFIEGDGTCSAPPVARFRAEAPAALFPADGA